MVVVFISDKKKCFLVKKNHNKQTSEDTTLCTAEVKISVVLVQVAKRKNNVVQQTKY